MKRRQFLTSAAGLASAAAVLPDASGAAARTRPAGYFVPGYRPDLAHFRGRPLAEAAGLNGQLPKSYDGPVTLLTRIDESDGSALRALMPIRGHALALRPDRGLAVWNSMEGEAVISLNPLTLELHEIGRFKGEGIVGGGHAVFAQDGVQVIVTERRRLEAYTGRPADHYGQVTIREADTLRILETYGSHGMAPHDIALLDDGKHIAIAHYGSHLSEGGWLPEIAEPCLTVLELASGRLVEKLAAPDSSCELRHLAAGGFDRLAAVLVRRGSRAEEAALLAGRAEVYEWDSSTRDAGAYLPAPVMVRAAERKARLGMPKDPLLARQAQSILYDPIADEMLVTFASSHAIGVFDAASGRCKQSISMDKLGLRYPRGIALHPDGMHYAVSGSWRDLILFRRGTHEPRRSIYAVLFEHSHLAIG